MIVLRTSTSQHLEMITALKEWIIEEYLEKVSLSPWILFLLPFFLAFLSIYCIYLLLYSLVILFLYIQEWGLLDLVFYIDITPFMWISLIIIFPINLALFLVSTLVSLPILICLNIFYGILYVIQLPFHALRNATLANQVQLSLLPLLDDEN